MRIWVIALTAALALPALTALADPTPMVGKYVRISIPGNKKILSIAEVQVMSDGDNVALKRPVTQSSTGAGGVPERAVDGNTDGTYSKASTTHTDNDGTDNPWWMVDLGEAVGIDEVVVHNRLEAAGRIQGAMIEVLDADRNIVSKSEPFLEIAPEYRFRNGTLTIPCPEEEALYAREGTWKETAVATFENYHPWHAQQFLRDLKRRSRVTMSARIAGPFKAADESNLRPEDAGESVSIMGQSYPWRDLDGFKVGNGNDLAEMAGLKKGDCALLRLDFDATKSSRGRFSLVMPHSLKYGRFVTENGLKQASLSSFPLNTPFQHPNSLGPGVRRILTKGSRSSYYSPVKVADDGTCFVSVSPYDAGIKSGNGPTLPHLDMPLRLYRRILSDFPDVKSRVEMKLEFEDAIWDSAPGSTGNEYAKSWFSGRAHEFLAWHYGKSVERIVAEAPELCRRLSSQNADVILEHLARVAAMPDNTYEQALERFRLAKYAEVLIVELGRLDRAIMAVADQLKTYGNGYVQGAANLKLLRELKQTITQAVPLFDKPVAAAQLVMPLGKIVLDSEQMRAHILLQNPVLGDALIMTEGEIGLNPNWTSMDRYGMKVVSLSPVNPHGKITALYTNIGGSINSIDLDWDAETVLVCDNKSIKDVRTDGSGESTAVKVSDKYAHDACRLPDGRIIFSSTTIEQAVPCTGGANVANLHIIDGDGSNQRRLCFDQDHNWHPSVMDDGRVMYLRWEYTGQVHYFSRIVMSTNPDGTGQASRYGSNSYWPNAVFWPRQIPGWPSRFIGIVSGHHGVKKQGHLCLFDVAKGRFQADGVMQKIGERSKAVEPVIEDRLVDGLYPHYITPYPLGRTAEESGKYFLATGKMNEGDGWGLYLLDVYDNRTLIAAGNYANARPFAKRTRPPVISDRVELNSKTATVFISDVYFGPGLEGIERGTVRSLRVASPVFRYAGNGDTYASALQGGWDIKRILGTTPVEADGSAAFQVPANTPVFVQPLNAEGQAMQIMRSWFVAMPGESLSCVGCHEDQNAVPPQTPRLAAARGPRKLVPWQGEARTFSFRREIQPMLDRRCVGCHRGRERRTPSGMEMPDFRATEETPDKAYSKAYVELQKYVRRSGVEPDAHLARPTEWMADTSHLVKMLKKGHHNVTLDQQEWERLYTWIDLNIPYPGSWSESHRPPKPQQVTDRVKYLREYANIDYHIERSLPMPEPVAFERPSASPPRAAALAVDGWPFDSSTAEQMQTGCGLKPKEIVLAGSVKMQLVPVPDGRYIMGDGSSFMDEPRRVVTIDRPFYMGSTEATYAQYRLFATDHENGFIDGRGKDRKTRGVCDMNQPDFPVVRVSLNEANAFCKWLSARTGLSVSLPTEQQWEWAARAGSGGAHYLSPAEQAKGYNIADQRNQKWNHGRYQNGHDDDKPWVTDAKSFTPNAWGLYNMLGNVAEWTASPYSPLPGVGTTKEASGRTTYNTVRGGSWNDTAAFASLSSRWRYMPSQPIHDVGFRVVVCP